MNRFLRGHRVIGVERRWVDLGADSYWSFCVDYLESGTSSGSTPRGGVGAVDKVDYREVLSPEQFAKFVRSRSSRSEISKSEGVPVYATFTNERLAGRGG
ncbi:MAG: hypothetical protein AB7I30_12545, partial [Isosphaeraceae bacterium]